MRRILAATVFLLVAAGAALADDDARIEGVVTAVHQNDFVLSRNGRQIVVDMSPLGGVTAAIAQGQPVAVIGRMAPDGQRFIARRLEPSPANPR